MSIRPMTGDGSTLEWTKSTYSTNEGPECVEVAAAPDTVLVRDSKDTTGPRLSFGADTWGTFVAFTVAADR